MYEVNLMQVQDITMQYAAFGAGEKTLVVLPGISVQEVAGLAPLLEPVFASFAAYKVYLFDRRRNAPAGYSVAQMARDTAKVMQTLGLRDCDVYGASQGGMLAMYLAGQNPELVHKLVLASTAASMNEICTPVFAVWKAMAKAKDREHLARHFAKTVYGAGAAAQAEPVLAEQSKTYTEEELERFVIFCEAFDSVQAPLNRIQCPTFVLGAADDRVFGMEAGQEIARRLSCASFFYGPEYGHAVYDEAPDFYNRVLDFLQK